MGRNHSRINGCLRPNNDVGYYYHHQCDCTVWHNRQSLHGQWLPLHFEYRHIHCTRYEEHRFSAFGGNQNYTVRCFRTIDSCRRSVFQYGDTFNIIRVKVVHGTTFYTVNQDIGDALFNVPTPRILILLPSSPGRP